MAQTKKSRAKSKIPVSPYEVRMYDASKDYVPRGGVKEYTYVFVDDTGRMRMAAFPQQFQRRDGTYNSEGVKASNEFIERYGDDMADSMSIIHENPDGKRKYYVIAKYARPAKDMKDRYYLDMYETSKDQADAERLQEIARRNTYDLDGDYRCEEVRTVSNHRASPKRKTVAKKRTTKRK